MWTRSAYDLDCRCVPGDLRCSIGAWSAAARRPVEADAQAIVTGALVAGLLAGYGIAIPVGAVATYLVALTARTSLKTGVCAALGVAAADGFYALVAVVGGTALSSAVESVAVPLRWTSSAILVLLGARIGFTAVLEYRSGRLSDLGGENPTSAVRAFVVLFGITLMNPTTVIYFTALVLGNQGAAARTLAEQAVFVLAAFLASASWQLLLAGGGAFLGRLLTGTLGRLTTALVSSSLITVLAVQLLIRAP